MCVCHSLWTLPPALYSLVWCLCYALFIPLILHFIWVWWMFNTDKQEQELSGVYCLVTALCRIQWDVSILLVRQESSSKKKSFSNCKKKLVHLAFTGPAKVNPHWVLVPCKDLGVLEIEVALNISWPPFISIITPFVFPEFGLAAKCL